MQQLEKQHCSIQFFITGTTLQSQLYSSCFQYLVSILVEGEEKGSQFTDLHCYESIFLSDAGGGGFGMRSLPLSQSSL